MTQAIEHIEIMRLTNSILYGVEVAFIVILDDSYRLIAIHKDRVLIDQKYPTQRGAKIAFTKYFLHDKMTAALETKPAWSSAYEPEAAWITPYLKICHIEDTVTGVR